MKILSSFILFLVFINCYTAERDCVSFHNGIFEFETIVNNQLESSRFIRNDSIEIEYYKGEVDSASIRWVNDCECVLTKLNPKNNQEKRPIRMRILTTKKNSYTFEYSLVGNLENTRRGTIKRIE